MALLTADCPRCGAHKMTFDVLGNSQLTKNRRYNQFEAFSRCRHCSRCTIFVVEQNNEHVHNFLDFDGSIEEFADIISYVSMKDFHTRRAPDHIPDVVASAFMEAATCLSVGCHSASVVMSRKCIDLAITPLLPETDSGGPKKPDKMPLGPRLDWLFDKGLLPISLKALADSVKEDGNDGAHSGLDMNNDDAEDALDFVYSALERLYTEPGRIDDARKRREKRRSRTDIDN